MLIKKLVNTKFKKDLSISYASKLIIFSFGFLQILLINRYYGVEIFGQLTIIVSSAGIFSSLVTAKSSEAVTRFFTREILNNNIENAKFILVIGIVIDIFISLLLVLLVYLCSNLISEKLLQNMNLSFEVFIYSFVGFFTFLRGTLIGYFQAKEMFFQINLISVIEAFVKISLLVISIFYFEQLIYIIYIFIFASFISYFYSLILFLKHYKLSFSNIKININKDLLKEYFSFNLKTFTSSSLKIGTTNIDNLILAYYTNSEIVGIYQTLKKIFSPLLFVVSPISMLKLTQTVRLYENKEFFTLHKLIYSITAKLTIFSVFILICLFFILKYYFMYQNIQYTNEIAISFIILSFYFILPTLIWWSRNFIIMYNPTIPIYTNLILTFTSILFPIILFELNILSPLIAISLSILLALIPSWIFAPLIYIKFMKKQNVI